MHPHINNVTNITPSASFEAIKKPTHSRLEKLTNHLARDILPESYKDVSSQEFNFSTLNVSSSALGRLFRPLTQFLKETLKLPLSEKELAKKIEEFVSTSEFKNATGVTMNSAQIRALAESILSQQSHKARSLKGRAQEGGTPLSIAQRGFGKKL